jgi:hypothetical protein
MAGGVDHTPYLEDSICCCAPLVRVGIYRMEHMVGLLGRASLGDLLAAMHNGRKAVLSVAKHLGVQTHDIVAHSLGGKIATLAGQEDHCCREVMLLASTPDVLDASADLHELPQCPVGGLPWEVRAALPVPAPGRAEGGASFQGPRQHPVQRVQLHHGNAKGPGRSGQRLAQQDRVGPTQRRHRNGRLARGRVQRWSEGAEPGMQRGGLPHERPVQHSLGDGMPVVLALPSGRHLELNHPRNLAVVHQGVDEPGAVAGPEIGWELEGDLVRLHYGHQPHGSCGPLDLNQHFAAQDAGFEQVLELCLAYPVLWIGSLSCELDDLGG